MALPPLHQKPWGRKVYWELGVSNLEAVLNADPGSELLLLRSIRDINN